VTNSGESKADSPDANSLTLGRIMLCRTANFPMFLPVWSCLFSVEKGFPNPYREALFSGDFVPKSEGVWFRIATCYT
jgi:hypothetical protein